MGCCQQVVGGLAIYGPAKVAKNNATNYAQRWPLTDERILADCLKIACVTARGASCYLGLPLLPFIP